MTKPFTIPKKLVWDAYLKVKENGGTAGVDEESIEMFERDLKKNLYRLWNRMSSGSYFPPPVLEVEIPKRNGGMRPLGIPTVADRIAQTVVKMWLEPQVEPSFHSDSYGYRPGRSCLDAVSQARTRCWRYDWLIDLDIRSFFDTLNHELLMRAVRWYTDCRWIVLYIERWLKAPIQKGNSTLQTRKMGTPQGGAVSPLLANIFLHFAFDLWMKRTYPGLVFERYADDIVIHCRSEAEACRVLNTVTQRLADCHLEVHKQKTQIVYCKDANRSGEYARESFDFLGYTFRPRQSRNRRGEYFVSFSPAISRAATKRLRQTMRRDWRIARRTDKSLNDLANMFNPVLRGWIQYYGKFYRSALYRVFRTLDLALTRWARRKFRRFKGHKTRASKWLARIQVQQPRLFAHWHLLGTARMAG